MEASRHKVISGTPLGYLSPKDMNQASSSFFSISPSSNSSASVARELLMNGTSAAEAIGLKGSSPPPPCSPVQPSKQLEYLARIQGFQVWIKSKNKNTKTRTQNSSLASNPSSLSIRKLILACLVWPYATYMVNYSEHRGRKKESRTHTPRFLLLPVCPVILLLPGSAPFSFCLPLLLI